jgi:predicted enzyme related to lactoylglutathione lyase
MVKGLNTVICQVGDMDVAVAFYRDILGLTPGVVSPYWTDFDLGGARLGLHPAFRPSEGAGGWVIGLEVDDIVALRETLASGGFETTAEYHDTPSGVVLDFTDPFGNALQAIQFGLKASDLDTP